MQLQQDDLNHQLREQDTGRLPSRLPPGQPLVFPLHPHPVRQQVSQEGKHQKPVHPKRAPLPKLPQGKLALHGSEKMLNREPPSPPQEQGAGGGRKRGHPVPPFPPSPRQRVSVPEDPHGAREPPQVDPAP